MHKLRREVLPPEGVQSRNSYPAPLASQQPTPSLSPAAGATPAQFTPEVLQQMINDIGPPPSSQYPAQMSVDREVSVWLAGFVFVVDVVRFSWT